MEFRTAYSNPDDFPGAEPVVDCTGDPGMTKQEFAEESDINNIMRRYVDFGQLPPSAVIEPSYGDVSDVGDFMDAQNRVLLARQQFEALPSRVRDRFANDPARLVAFLADASNRAEAIELGLVKRPDISDVPVVVPSPKEGTPKSSGEGVAVPPVK